jgi:hypothetical protein
LSESDSAPSFVLTSLSRRNLSCTMRGCGSVVGACRPEAGSREWRLQGRWSIVATGTRQGHDQLN